MAVIRGKPLGVGAPFLFAANPLRDRNRQLPQDQILGGGLGGFLGCPECRGIMFEGLFRLGIDCGTQQGVGPPDLKSRQQHLVLRKLAILGGFGQQAFNRLDFQFRRATTHELHRHQTGDQQDEPNQREGLQTGG